MTKTMATAVTSTYIAPLSDSKHKAESQQLESHNTQVYDSTILWVLPEGGTSGINAWRNEGECTLTQNLSL